jgi:DNA-binding transcriptional regulator YdaS (Cro superfamily)
MNLKQYIQLNRGEGKRLAQVLAIDKSYLSQMVSNDRPISPERCVAIERETNRLVTRQELRPEDYWLIWPDLKAPKGKK